MKTWYFVIRGEMEFPDDLDEGDIRDLIEDMVELKYIEIDLEESLRYPLQG